VRFLDADLGLEMDRGPCLVCGDTGSDVPMLQASLERASATKAVFVTGDDALRRQVRGLVPEAVFVREPDSLVAALNGVSRGPRD
jgi:hypothetical protein